MAATTQLLDVDELCAETDREEAFELLSNSRRRTVLYVLYQHDAELPMSDLVSEVASIETDTPVDELDDEREQSMYISLYQTHLPKLDSYGLVEYDEDARTISLTARAREALVSADRLEPGRWHRYYALVLALGVLACVGAFLLNGVGGWRTATLLVVSGLGGVTVAHTRAMRDRSYSGSYLSLADLI